MDEFRVSLMINIKSIIMFPSCCCGYSETHLPGSCYLFVVVEEPMKGTTRIWIIIKTSSVGGQHLILRHEDLSCCSERFLPLFEGD